ncbi:hypothetical protein [Mycolicibacterium chubuense]|uniref:hypothetical protein n=1 Tax=Mycolicibacterium chubuense TaxID=1800 RepID=UPI0005A2DC28|nr:hypothetical protein [Mycolicibacterium chubuense]
MDLCALVEFVLVDMGPSIGFRHLFDVLSGDLLDAHQSRSGSFTCLINDSEKLGSCAVEVIVGWLVGRYSLDECPAVLGRSRSEILQNRVSTSNAELVDFISVVLHRGYDRRK